MSEIDAGRAGAGPAVQEKRPLPVVGKAVTLAQFPQLGDGVPQPRQASGRPAGGPAGSPRPRDRPGPPRPRPSGRGPRWRSGTPPPARSPAGREAPRRMGSRRGCGPWRSWSGPAPGAWPSWPRAPGRRGRWPAPRAGPGSAARVPPGPHGQRGVAAGEDQAQHVVAQRRLRLHRLDRLLELVRRRPGSPPERGGLLGRPRRLAAQQVKRLTPGDHGQPRPRVIGDPRFRPGVQGGDRGLGERVLGDGQIADGPG